MTDDPTRHPEDDPALRDLAAQLDAIGARERAAREDRSPVARGMAEATFERAVRGDVAAPARSAPPMLRAIAAVLALAIIGWLVLLVLRGPGGGATNPGGGPGVIDPDPMLGDDDVVELVTPRGAADAFGAFSFIVHDTFGGSAVAYVEVRRADAPSSLLAESDGILLTEPDVPRTWTFEAEVTERWGPRIEWRVIIVNSGMGGGVRAESDWAEAWLR